MKFFLAIYLVIFFYSLPAQGVAQNFIPQDGLFCDVDGVKISFGKFLEKMKTGQFQIVEGTVDNEAAKCLKPKGTMAMQPKARHAISMKGAVNIEVAAPGHILMPVKIEGTESTIEGLVAFDTGTFIPLILLSEFKDALGSITSMHVSGAVIKNLGTGSYSFENRVRELNTRYADTIQQKFPGKQIMGIAGISLFRGACVDLKLGDSKIVLNKGRCSDQPSGGKQKVSVRYDARKGNIWVPVMANQVSGYIHIDSGYPQSWYEKTYLKKGISDLEIGADSIAGWLNLSEWNGLDQLHNYRTIPLKLIAGLGSDSLKQLDVQIDQETSMISFSKHE